MSERQGSSCIVAKMYAYLDAGTGSMLMAAFAGGAAGIGVQFSEQDGGAARRRIETYLARALKSDRQTHTM